MTADDLCIMEHRRDPLRPRRALDGLYLCTGHLAELRRLVAELPARAADLRRPARAAGIPVSGTGDPGLSVDEIAAGLRQHMTGILASWCRLIVEDRGLTSPDGPDLSHTAPVVLAHLEWCAGHRWVDEMLLELREVTARSIGVTDIPARHIPLAARCRTTDEDGEQCEGEITVVVRGDDWLARCSACHDDQDAIPYLTTARRSTWITSAEVIALAAVFGIAASDDVVRQWKHRRRIAGVPGPVEALYDLRSVQKYLTDRTERERMTA